MMEWGVSTSTSVCAVAISSPDRDDNPGGSRLIFPTLQMAASSASMRLSTMPSFSRQSCRM